MPKYNDFQLDVQNSELVNESVQLNEPRTYMNCDNTRLNTVCYCID